MNDMVEGIEKSDDSKWIRVRNDVVEGWASADYLVAVSGYDLRKIDIDKFKTHFVAKFCYHDMTPEQCHTRWDNFSLLLNYIEADTRITNIGIAAFLMATAYTETETRDFSPAAEEKKGDVNKDRDYFKPDSQTHQTYFGRGWVQLTYKEMYQKAKNKLGIDFVNQPDLALEKQNSYNILSTSLIDGWLETYRSNNAGHGGTVPIKLGDFLKDGKLDYSLARAVINANCIGNCTADSRFEFKENCFIPKSAHLDASAKNAEISIFFETAIRESLVA